MQTTYKETIIIGAGQSGLATAYFLLKEGKDFIILEKTDKVASTWRNHYDSLRLITPNPFISLAGEKFKSPNKFPTKNEVVDYLDEYSLQFIKNLMFNTKVFSISKKGTLFKLETNKQVFNCKNVVVATGYNGIPFTPVISKRVHKDVYQIHASQYKCLQSFSNLNLKVAVIGSGNSGVSIAEELSSKHEVYLFQGKVKRFPRKIMGLDIFWWANTFGLFKVRTGTFIGDRLSKKLIPQGDPTYGLYPSKIAKKNDFKLLNRLTNVEGNILIDSDNKKAEVDAIVWATGYKTNYHEFIHEDIFNEEKNVIHTRGVTSVEGLYFVGLKWQSNISSFLIFGVKHDAKYIFEHLKSRG